MSTVGTGNERLRHERELRGWSQEEVAKAVGTDQKVVSRWERGISRPSPYFRKKLCDLYGKNTEELGLLEQQAFTSPQEAVDEQKHPEEAATSSPNQPELALPPTSIDLSRMHPIQIVVPNGTLHTAQPNHRSNDAPVLVILHGGNVSAIQVPLQTEVTASVGNTQHNTKGGTLDMDALRRTVIQEITAILGTSLVVRQDIVNSDMLEQVNHASKNSLGSAIDEATLGHFRRVIEGCWRLTQGSDVYLIEQLLPTFLPNLEAIALHSSKQQSEIAQLASQGQLLRGLVALEQLDLSNMEKTSILAAQYSKVARNHDLQAAALKQLATMYLIAKDPAKALQTYQRVLPFIHHLSPLLQSRIYQGLASASARCGREQDARRHLGLAFDTFPSGFEQDPSFLYADSNLSLLYMYVGLTQLDLDEPHKAWETFAHVDGLQPKTIIGESMRREFVNLQAKAAISMRDQERSRTYLEVAVQLADRLDSQFGRTEAFDLWQDMRLVWPGDKNVKNLGSLFLR